MMAIFRRKKGKRGKSVSYPITPRRARAISKPRSGESMYDFTARLKTESQKLNLRRMIKNGVMNADLRTALNATLDALNKGDLELAYELSAVKSYIVGEIDPTDTENHFQEDSKANEKILGRDIYSMMDSIHHDIAFKMSKIPSGAVIYSSTGVGGMPAMTEKGPAKRKHPVIEKMEQEHEQMEREVQARHPT